MFESITFITDAGRKLLCGKNTTSHHDYDDGYGSHGGGYSRGYPTSPYSAETPDAHPVAVSSIKESPVPAAQNGKADAIRGAHSKADGTSSQPSDKPSSNPRARDMAQEPAKDSNTGDEESADDAPSNADEDAADKNDSYIGYKDGDDSYSRGSSTRYSRHVARKALKDARTLAHMSRRNGHRHNRDGEHSSKYKGGRQLLADSAAAAGSDIEEDELAATERYGGYRGNRNKPPQDPYKRRHHGQPR